MSDYLKTARLQKSKGVFVMFLFFEASVWERMFQLDETVSLVEKILRPVIVYLGLIVLVRFFGRRELGQLNPLDLIVLLMLSETIQNSIIGEDNSVTGGIIGAAMLFSMNYIFALLKFKSPKLEKIIEGEPIVLIENGKFDERAINREMLSREDLDVVAHKEGFESADDLQKCVLDPNGSFLVEGKDDAGDKKFKKDVLRKIEDLSEQIGKLQAALQKS